jgi:hypothetical protein
MLTQTQKYRYRDTRTEGQKDQQKDRRTEGPRNVTLECTTNLGSLQNGDHLRLWQQQESTVVLVQSTQVRQAEVTDELAISISDTHA